MSAYETLAWQLVGVGAVFLISCGYYRDRRCGTYDCGGVEAVPEGWSSGMGSNYPFL